SNSYKTRFLFVSSEVGRVTYSLTYLASTRLRGLSVVLAVFPSTISASTQLVPSLLTWSLKSAALNGLSAIPANGPVPCSLQTQRFSKYGCSRSTVIQYGGVSFGDQLLSLSPSTALWARSSRTFASTGLFSATFSAGIYLTDRDLAFWARSIPSNWSVLMK